MMTGGLWPWGLVHSENKPERQRTSSLRLASTKFCQSLFSAAPAVLLIASAVPSHSRETEAQGG